MNAQRGYSLIELVIAIAIVGLVCATLIVGFTRTLELEHASDAADTAALEAHNLAVSLRAAMAYDRGAVAAVESAGAQSYSITGPSATVTSATAGTVLNLTVTAAPSSVSVAVPLAQEVPMPYSTVLGAN